MTMVVVLLCFFSGTSGVFSTITSPTSVSLRFTLEDEVKEFCADVLLHDFGLVGPLAGFLGRANQKVNTVE